MDKAATEVQTKKRLEYIRNKEDIEQAQEN
jgi:hypothetical protein